MGIVFMRALRTAVSRSAQEANGKKVLILENIQIKIFLDIYLLFRALGLTRA